MKKLKFIGTKPEVVSALGGRRIQPDAELFVPDNLAPRLLRTKRFEQVSKTKMKPDSKKHSATAEKTAFKSTIKPAKGDDSA